ncbi:MAG: tRNA lysidine(34) synthetase TilS [Verrucomicrobiae bacterium]|nr:tRNA lysidine(34) synthetase TilS [Verrucomicrobiae bacterium]
MNAEALIATFARDFSPRKKALIGVSGGRDSVALLHALKSAGFRKLVVCHLDHGLRGRASTEDAKFVRRLAARWDFPVEVGKVDVDKLAETQKLSLETAAREARHAFFAQQAKAHRCQRIFLAHHADDQVETVLHQLFRGSGLAGLGGMAPVSELKVGRTTLEVLRPLLGCWREEIEAYVEANRLSFREDETNASLDFATRNRWRHELFPAIQKSLGRDPRTAVWRLAEIARDEEAAIDAEIDSRFEEIAEGGDQLRLTPLRKLPVAWQRRVLKRWLQARGVSDIGFEVIERVRAILPAKGAPAAKVNLPGGGFARRRAGVLFFER